VENAFPIFKVSRLVRVHTDSHHSSSIFRGFQPQFGLDSAESDVTFDLVSRPLIFPMSEYRPSRSMGGDSCQHVQTCRTI